MYLFLILLSFRLFLHVAFFRGAVGSFRYFLLGFFHILLGCSCPKQTFSAAGGCTCSWQDLLFFNGTELSHFVFYFSHAPGVLFSARAMLPPLPLCFFAERKDTVMVARMVIVTV